MANMRKKYLLSERALRELQLLFNWSKELADVVLVDIPQLENPAKGKALDMLEASPVQGFDANITGTANYEDTADSDIVIITAGIARKPGMSRDDLVTTNQKL